VGTDVNGYVAAFDRLIKTLVWSSYVGACEPSDISAGNRKVFLSALRYGGSTPLMDATDYYADTDPNSVGDAVVMGFNNAGLFYGSNWGGDSDDILQSLSYTAEDDRLYIGGRTRSSSLFPLHCPPIVDPIHPPWCVNALQPDGDDLFYGQLKLDLELGSVGQAPEALAQSTVLYPNPANDQVTLHFSDELLRIAVHIAVHNMLGQEVACDPHIGPTGITIGTSAMAAGTYTLEVMSRDRKVVYIGRFVRVP
jgi:hypothetical protein